ncbi:STAS domain-containing protein [Streptomyces sp. NPDC048383]|uniref:STAS domain-containing protein n=1 Tax=Streptomyces sp. NPDC048383 TaxID=3155386 RepID=UPI00341D2944
MEQQVDVLPDEDGVRVIACTGEFDQDILGPLKAACTAATDDPGVRRIVLDVTQVAFADSSMLNLMLRLRATDRLVLAGPLPAQLARLLDVTSARTLFLTAEGIEAARVL